MLWFLLENICYIDIKPGIYAVFQTACEIFQPPSQKKNKMDVRIATCNLVEDPSS